MVRFISDAQFIVVKYLVLSNNNKIESTLYLFSHFKATILSALEDYCCASSCQVYGIIYIVAKYTTGNASSYAISALSSSKIFTNITKLQLLPNFADFQQNPYRV